MMQLKEIFIQAWNALKANQTRAILTMLGMVWGIATVVVLLAYGDGFERALMTAFESFGTSTIAVFPGVTNEQVGGQKAGVRIRFTLEDVERLQTEIPLINHISPEVRGNFKFVYGIRSKEFEAIGVYPVYGKMRRIDLSEGRFLSEDDLLSHRRVVILGNDIKKKLFSGAPAVGESVRIGGLSFEVVGVMKAKIQDDEGAENRRAFIPFTSLSDLRSVRYIGGIILEPLPNTNHQQVAKAVRESLARHHQFNPTDRRAVFVWNMAEELDEIRIVTVALKIFLAFIGTLTLSIGGVGVMNIMLVSVTERTREIGVRKSLGAKKRHILFQFLVEALVIAGIGGAIGILLSYAISALVGSLPLWSAIYGESAKDGDIRLVVSSSALMVSSVILFFVGLVSGLLPAVKAARLNPVDTLRYE